MKKNEEAKSYQELKQSLDAVLARLQHEDTDIDAAITLHEDGQAILKELNAYLQRVAKHAEIDIKKLN
ncbi:MAG: exodeoxyribonuclease VII small subunit [Candidatus Saccharimonadales bacterium]